MRLLLAPRYDLLLAESGEEALERVREFKPDVVLCDLILPGISGAEVCRRMRADPGCAEIPFVLVTTLADSDARADGLEAGADDYLYKPLRERELLARVASLVRLRREMVAAAERLQALEAANGALREAQSALVRAEKLASVGALAAGLSHEINNPLSCIKSGASALVRTLAEIGLAASEALAQGAAPAAREQLEQSLAEAGAISLEMEDGSRRLERLAADLRVFTGPATCAEELVDPAEALQSAWTLARSKFQAVPCMKFELEPGDLLVASRALVTVPLVAVLEHAISAAGPGGHVLARVRQVSGGVEIAVRDSGPGIPREVLPRVFDPFFTARRGADGPAAPGLSVASGIVHGLGGAIAVESPPEGGVTFRMRFPRRPGAFAGRTTRARGDDAGAASPPPPMQGRSPSGGEPAPCRG
jgi:C4-dicarboxylate-specific signal transduction histidine kinase